MLAQKYALRSLSASLLVCLASASGLVGGSEIDDSPTVSTVRDRAFADVELGLARHGPPAGSDVTDTNSDQASLREKVRQCLATYFRQPVRSADSTPWEVMHAAVGFGVDTQLVVEGRQLNALGWLCWNGACRGRRLLEVRNGRVLAKRGSGVQGHAGQFLSVLALSRVRSDYRLRVAGEEFTVSDLVEREKLTCVAGTELTFKLIGLVHYLNSDATWSTGDDEGWSIQRMLREEMTQPVVGAACGGTHRMMGFGYAIRKRAQRGKPFEGEWQRALQFVKDFHEYTFTLQNSNGSFSSNWFAGRGDSGGVARRLQTTGHTLEWMILSLPDDQLSDPRVAKSVEYLADLLLDHRQNKWPIGALGHALHALTMYDERVYEAKPGKRQLTLDQQQLAMTE